MSTSEGVQLRRRSDDRVVAGVASGLAAYLGIDPAVLRVVLVVLTAAGGWGILLYAVGWAAMPLAAPDAAPRPAPSSVRAEPGRDVTRLVAVGMITVGMLLLLRRIGLAFSDQVVWPMAVVAAGALVIWRRSPNLSWARGDGDRGVRVVDILRILFGLVLAIGGIIAFVTLSFSLEAVTTTLAALIVVAGVALIFAPWWWRLVTELGEERRRRIHSDARAELAAHLHDSVLQTLALIQKRSDDPATTASLARRQERELRRWLYGGPQVIDGSDFGAALRAAMAEVEDLHGVPIEVVVVGEAAHDDRTDALVAAVREAAVNASKHSGAPVVDVYAEAGPEMVEVFVRDRGVGFEMDAVGADRRGITHSIVERMHRAGGDAFVSAEPGAGVEVELSLPRRVAA
ncbi:MAG: PspC domain-containing protein [Actinomycetota bacterium]|nr:PspC domain-containing protein [Actinomycetota bacterium]